MIFSSFIIITFIKYKQCRKQPGDIILGISVADFILSSHWFITALFSNHGRFGPHTDEDSLFCHINAVFSVIGGVFTFLYNVSFCLYVILVIRNALKKSTIWRKRFHVVVFTFTFIILLYCIWNKTLGQTKYGTCSMKSSSKKAYFSFVPLILFIIFAWVTLVYIRMRLPNAKKILKAKNELITFYSIYILIISVFYLMIAIMFMYNSTKDEVVSFNHKMINTAGNIAKIANSVILGFIRV